MPVGALRALVLQTNQDVHGVLITVVRPAPDQDPVDSTGRWSDPLVQERRVGTDFTARDPRRVLVVPKSATLAVMPRGTLITAPDVTDATPRLWRVDGLEGPTMADQWRLIVSPAG